MNLSNEHIFDGGFGLERETLRVTANGSMAQTDHPFPEDKYLERDFCENQLELITPVCKNTTELMETLEALDKRAKETLLEHGEYLWMSSNPPHIEGDSDIPVARYSAEKAFKYDYRINLERRYGKRLMLYSGIHVNISFSDELLLSECGGVDFESYKNTLYFRLFKHLSRTSWFLVLLTAASPVYDLSLDGDNLSGDGFDGCASRRSGEKGYWNQFVPVLDYTDINSYVQSVGKYIEKGALFSASELYVPIRLKPRGANSLEALLEGGADHIELRIFDVNPLSPLGIFKEDIDFAHYFLIYLASLDDFEFTPEMQKAAIKNHKAAARYDLKEIKIDGIGAGDAALSILDGMAEYFKNFDFVLKSIAAQREKLTENKRYCVRVYEKYHEHFQDKMLLTAKGDGENV